MYAIGDAKYDFSSFRAIARMLLIRSDSFRRVNGVRARGRRRRVFVFGGEREEDILEADAHRPQLEQAPAAADHGARELATDVAALFAVDLVADHAVVAIRFHDARDARQPGEGDAGVRAV